MTDFKEALEYFKDGQIENETIIRALRICDFLQNGEPTDGMIDAWISEKHAAFAEDTARCKFNAMIAQMFEEIK